MGKEIFTGVVGIVFKLTASGTETALHAFGGLKTKDGSYPSAVLAMDGQGNLYGTTFYGGVEPAGSRCGKGCGTVFEVTAAGTESVLYAFQGKQQKDGAIPGSGLVMDAQGNLYGTTESGGAFNAGTIFKLTHTGVETVLYSFTGGADGGSPQTGLVMDAQGNFYGATYAGGTHGLGTVFKLVP